jgi:hypothetical protein
MPAKRKPCPYSTADALETAIREHGSVEGLSTASGDSCNVIRRWARELGARTASGNLGAPPAIGTLVLERMADAELETFVQTFGITRAADLLDVSESTVRKQLRGRNLSGSTTMVASPRAMLLSRRVKELEQQDASMMELAAQIQNAAEIVATEPPPMLPRIKTRRDRSPVDVILHVSDKQYGMLVDPDEVPGGAYSPELYEERLARYLVAVDALLENTANANPIGTLWIAQGGDFVEGDDVFKGHAWHLAIDAGEQVVRLGRIWAAAVQRISQRARQVGAKRVAVVSVVGNHGVKGGRSAGAVPPSLNYDYLTYELVRSQLEGTSAVDYYDAEPRQAVYFETAGGVVLLTHGEQDKGGGLIGVPVVTGMRNSLTAMVSTGVRPVLHLSGHFHRPAQISLSSDLMRIWSGPWVGQTNLSIGRGGASSPSQHMLVMHPEHGMIAQHVIRLTSATESPVEVVKLSA